MSLWYVSLPDPREEEKEKKGKRMLMGKGDKLARDEKQRTAGCVCCRLPSHVSSQWGDVSQPLSLSGLPHLQSHIPLKEEAI